MTANSNKKKAVERFRDSGSDSLKLNLVKPKLFTLLITVFAIMFFYLQAILWIGEGSLAEVWRLKKSIALIEEKNKELQTRNQKLIDEVDALRNGLDLIEHRAREDLGLIKQNEVFYHLIDERSEQEKNPKTTDLKTIEKARAKILTQQKTLNSTSQVPDQHSQTKPSTSAKNNDTQ
jgi:cell division protein FtsB